MTKKYLEKHLPMAFLAFNALIIVGAAFVFDFGINQKPTLAESQLPADKPTTTAQNIQTSPFSEINIRARSAIVLDIKTGEVIYAKNIHERMPLASITKVMTALVAKKLIPLAENSTVTLTTTDLETEGDSGLSVGETWKLTDLINFSLIVSSNDGARAIAGVAGAASQKDFIESMNQEARDLGLDQTFFKNETGLDLPDNGGVGAQGSAENVARLFAYVYENDPKILAATNQETANTQPLNGNPHFIANTNEAINQISGILASKTGYTDLAGGNLAVIFDRGLNQPAVAVVLGSTQQGRFEDIVTLTKASVQDLQITLNSHQ